MPERVRKCPNCGGNLDASRFARAVRCTFCNSEVLLDPSAVEAVRFREAHAAWVDPAAHGVRDASRIAGASWVIGPMIAVGAHSDVHLAIRARTPSEVAVVRLARGAGAAHLDAAWTALRGLQASKAPGAAAMLRRLPEPVARGVVEAGPFAGREALLTRAMFGHPSTLAELSPPLDPRPTVWVWRRILEALAFLHASGVVHGAVTPAHVLIEAGEHGARLIGFGNAGAPGALPVVEERWRPIVPAPTSAAEDLRASARTIVWALGGDPTTGRADVPRPYADVLRSVATEERSSFGDAWALREHLGRVADATFGRPAFCPLIRRGG